MTNWLRDNCTVVMRDRISDGRGERGEDGLTNSREKMVWRRQGEGTDIQKDVGI